MAKMSHETELHCGQTCSGRGPCDAMSVSVSHDAHCYHHMHINIQKNNIGSCLPKGTYL